MKFKEWLFLFITTLLFGGLTIILASLVLGWEGITRFQGDFGELIPAVIYLFFAGVFFGAVSQMGMFAYLQIHRFGLGLFKTLSLWNWVQVLLIIFTFFDLIYFRYLKFGQEGETWLDYLWMPTIFLILAVIVAYVKAKQTNQTAFIPAIFFMFVVTTLEIIVPLLINDLDWLGLMLTTIFICNTWQLLMLHHLNKGQLSKSSH